MSCSAAACVRPALSPVVPLKGTVVHSWVASTDRDEDVVLNKPPECLRPVTGGAWVKYGARFINNDETSSSIRYGAVEYVILYFLRV